MSAAERILAEMNMPKGQEKMKKWAEEYMTKEQAKVLKKK